MTALPPRFTIGRLMAAVAVVAALLAFLRALGPEGIRIVPALLFFSTPGLCAGFMAWWWTRRRPRAAARGLILSSALLCVSVGVLDAYRLISLAFFLSFILAEFLVPLILAFGASWAVQATRPDASPRHHPAIAWLAVLGLAALPVSMMLTHWPLRLAFLASRPALERLADRVAAGETPSPLWAGAYRVVRTNLFPGGAVSLSIRERGGGYSSFVRESEPLPPEKSPLLVSSPNHATLGGRWRFHDED